MAKAKKVADEAVTKAEAGRSFKMKYGDEEWTVKPSCGENGRGHWLCVTHGEAFANQLQKDCHISDRREHALAWNCFEHGPEVP